MMRALRLRLRGLWRAVRHRDALDAEMQDEMRFHIDMEAERLMREHGLDATEARRRALVAFGGVTKYTEAGRDTRGVRWLDAISLDTRLALRMLAKHRGLTLVGGFAVAVAIAIGATFFEALGELLQSSLPLDEGDRIVAVQLRAVNADAEASSVIEDAVWRHELRSIEQLSAFRTTQLNLVTSGAVPEPIRVAEITPEGFAIARTPPQVGRHLLPSDGTAHAEPVVVVGYEAWTVRFGGDPQILGRSIQIGGVPRTVVGVMPRRFRFPVDHQYWIPLQRERVAELLSGELHLFGRLARGAALEQAQAELTSIGDRATAAATRPDTLIRPLVVPYTRAHLELTDPMLVSLFRMAQLLVGALVAVVAVNLAILFYARTVSRLGEIAVRTALGATRVRILAQLFVEALALAGVGAIVGLALADVALAGMQSLAEKNGSVPFWLEFELSPATTVYAFGLAITAAFITGVLPGVKATRRQLTSTLHETNDRSGTHVGPLWTTLIIAQVAVAVAILPVAGYLAWQVTTLELVGSGFADHRFVVGTVALGDDPRPPDDAAVRDRQLALMSQLAAEPGVAGVTFSSSVPGFSAGRTIELENRRATDPAAIDVSRIDVAVDFFELYEAQLLAGRSLEAADVGAARAVVVNDSFVDVLPPGTGPLGARFRYSRSRERVPEVAGEPWYQIVGVVRDFPYSLPALSLDTKPTVYHPATPGAVHPVVLSVRFAGELPDTIGPRIRAIGAAIDPAMQIRRVMPLSDFYRDVRSFWHYLAWGAALLTLSVLLLSAAGIYALMSLAVAQRTREIGIRTALGAHPRRVLAGVFARSIRQLSLGVAGGSMFSFLLMSAAGLDSVQSTTLLGGVAFVMLPVGVLATYGPARRALKIQASDALRAGV